MNGCIVIVAVLVIGYMSGYCGTGHHRCAQGISVSVSVLVGIPGYLLSIFVHCSVAVVVHAVAKFAGIWIYVAAAVVAVLIVPYIAGRLFAVQQRLFRIPVSVAIHIGIPGGLANQDDQFLVL